MCRSTTSLRPDPKRTFRIRTALSASYQHRLPALGDAPVLQCHRPGIRPNPAKRSRSLALDRLARRPAQWPVADRHGNHVAWPAVIRGCDHHSKSTAPERLPTRRAKHRRSARSLPNNRHHLRHRPRDPLRERIAGLRHANHCPDVVGPHDHDVEEPTRIIMQSLNASRPAVRHGQALVTRSRRP